MSRCVVCARAQCHRADLSSFIIKFKRIRTPDAARRLWIDTLQANPLPRRSRMRAGTPSSAGRCKALAQGPGQPGHAPPRPPSAQTVVYSCLDRRSPQPPQGPNRRGAHNPRTPQPACSRPARGPTAADGLSACSVPAHTVPASLLYLEPSALGPALGPALPRCIHEEAEEAEEAAQPPSLRAPSMPARAC